MMPNYLHACIHDVRTVEVILMISLHMRIKVILHQFLMLDIFAVVPRVI